jgi:hypothetical protein
VVSKETGYDGVGHGELIFGGRRPLFTRAPCVAGMTAGQETFSFCVLSRTPSEFLAGAGLENEGSDGDDFDVLLEEPRAE